MIHLTTAAQKYTYPTKNRLKLAGVFCALLMAGSPFAYADLLTDAQNGSMTAQEQLMRSFFWGSNEYPQDIQQAYHWALKAADQSSVKAFILLGNIYEYKNNSPTGKAEPELAMQWYLKAADQGSTEAMIHIGSLYRNTLPSHATTIERQQALQQQLQWYLKAADQGSTEAMMHIAWMYQSAEHSPTGQVELQKVEEWLLRVIAQNDFYSDHARLQLVRYYRGIAPTSATVKNPDKAFALLSEIVQHDRSDTADSAYIALFDMLQSNEKDLTTQEKQQLLKWVLTDANKGQASAQVLAGWLLGMENPQLAIEWYFKAAQQGYCEAQYRLGMIYLKGDGIPSDPEQGLQWLTQAAQQNDQNALNQLTEIYMEGKFAPQNDELTLTLIKRAAYHTHNMVAQYQLGQFYYDGRMRLAQDKAAAFAFFMQAAQQNYPPAQYRLALMYCKGEVLARDVEEGRAWLIRAEQGGVAEARQALQTVCK